MLVNSIITISEKNYKNKDVDNHIDSQYNAETITKA